MATQVIDLCSDADHSLAPELQEPSGRTVQLLSEKGEDVSCESLPVKITPSQAATCVGAAECL
jgi:hypothetical protein